LYRHNPLGFPTSQTQGNPADDATIAADKRALLPGEAPSFANVTSFDKGINGIMVDIAGLRPGAVVTPSDFGFGDAPDASVNVRPGAGTDGSDRVTLLWADEDPSLGNPDAVANGWLTVTVRAANLGLARPDVFSFGNLVGETGDGTGAAGWRVSALDLSAIKRALNTDAPITSPADFNRDGRVNALDLAIVKRNLNHSLPLIPPLTAAPAASDAQRRAAEEVLFSSPV
jgi:hypothetical protein